MIDRIRKIISEQIGVPQERVVDTADLYVDLGADCLLHLQMCLALEDEFQIEINDADCERLRTVADVISFIEQRAA